MTKLQARSAAFLAAGAATALALPADAAVSRWFEAHRSDGLNPAALGATCAWTLGAFVWAGCAGLAYLRRWRQAVLLGSATAAALLSGSAIKLLVGRRRPYDTLSDFVSLTTADDASFPSNHTNGAFAAAIVLSAFVPRLRPAFYLFATGIAATRLYVGVHFLSDVGGGIALALLVSSVALAYAEARGILPQTPESATVEYPPTREAGPTGA